MRTDPQHTVADALRKVAAQLEFQVNTGGRNWRIDAEDLRQTLLSVADELDPPLPRKTNRKPRST